MLKVFKLLIKVALAEATSVYYCKKNEISVLLCTTVLLKILMLFYTLKPTL